jgi:hypothetical protein
MKWNFIEEEKPEPYQKIIGRCRDIGELQQGYYTGYRVFHDQIKPENDDTCGYIELHGEEYIFHQWILYPEGID